MTTLKDFNIERFEGKLNNGIKVVLYHRKNTPISSVAILNSGAKYDPINAYGLNHMIEHMILKNSKQFPVKSSLFDYIQSIGGFCNASTGKDFLKVFVDVADIDNFTHVIDFYRATLNEPLMLRDVFETEKDIIITEEKRNKSNTQRLLQEQVYKLFFGNTPLEHLNVGTEEQIRSFDYENFLVQHKKMFDKSRITFVFSGDISLGNIIENLNALTFFDSNKFKKTDDNFSSDNKENKCGYSLDVPQTNIFFGFNGPKPNSKEDIVLVLIRLMLVGNTTCRISKRLRSEKGLVYTANCGSFGNSEFQAWGVITDCVGTNTQKVIDEIKAVISDLKSNPFTEKELEYAKNFTIKSKKISMQTSASWVNFHANLDSLGIDMTLDTFLNFVEELTLEEIKQVVDKYFDTSSWRLALVGKTNPEDIVI